ncbi:hypothetical protein K491DRAFT_157441 [Lophiostoma macrostomum CBS 122681]|uniref:F-box domain-containing protein n=1 Tax=Lophiostoma macrostomum CBS 122681 TaxID=1314788 RepID=A0A6A6SSG4_9PLEO|nr:hypothetical protein K491DRAFT_157441 [Lophiostoma macrostomum CBS 122681]
MDCKIWAFTHGIWEQGPIPRGSILPLMVIPENFPGLEELFLTLKSYECLPVREFDDPDGVDESKDWDFLPTDGLEIVHGLNQGGCDLFLQHIIAWAPTLRNLSLESWDGDVLSDVWPFETLAAFQSLEVFLLPQDLIFHWSWEPSLETEAPTHIAGFLPTSLQVLKILMPTLKIRDWLGGLLDWEGSLPELRYIELHCRNDAGEFYHIINEDEHVVWDSLALSGREVSVHCRDEDRYHWEGSDPKMLREVEFLDSLKDA